MYDIGQLVIAGRGGLMMMPDTEGDHSRQVPFFTKDRSDDGVIESQYIAFRILDGSFRMGSAVLIKQ